MRRFIPVVLGVLALSACASGDGSAAETHAPEPPPPSVPLLDDVARGRLLATAYCLSCHALSAGGASPNPDAPALSTLAERYPGTLLADAFPERMRVGHPAMPDFAFTDSQVDALLAFLLSIQERQGV